MQSCAFYAARLEVTRKRAIHGCRACCDMPQIIMAVGVYHTYHESLEKQAQLQCGMADSSSQWILANRRATSLHFIRTTRGSSLSRILCSCGPAGTTSRVCALFCAHQKTEMGFAETGGSSRLIRARNARDNYASFTGAAAFSSVAKGSH